MVIRPGKLLIIGLCIGCLSLSHAEDKEPADKAADKTEPSPKQQTPPPPPATPPDPMDLQRGLAIAKQFQDETGKAEQLHWFNERRSDRFLGLFMEESTGEPLGHVLILHDNQQHPDWPGLVNHFRQGFPEKGWSTLSISLPDNWQIIHPPPRDVHPPQQGQAAPDAAQAQQADKVTAAPSKALRFTQLSVEYSMDKLGSIIRARVKQALAYQKQQKALPIMVIAIGSSASWLAFFNKQHPMSEIAGLVIIDPVAIQDSEINPDIDAPSLQIPVLDIAPASHQRTRALPRKAQAKREKQDKYQQYIVPDSRYPFTGREPQLLSKIRGWANQMLLKQR